MEIQLVIFNLGRETFGVDISAVEGIIKMQPIVSIPQSPEFVEGVTNLRGKVIPVIDLRKRLSVSASALTKESRIVIINLNKSTVGMIVDSVNEVLRISDDTIEQTPTMVKSVNSEFVKGIAKVNNMLVILLDMTLILTRDEQVSLTMQLDSNAMMPA
jgi:purine-binding chemotaxis protein CheW